MFRLRRKRRDVNLDGRQLREIMQKELVEYIKQEDLQHYLDKIESDKEQKKTWDGWSLRKRMKVLRYVAKKEGGKHGKG